LIVYVAGPYADPDPEWNVDRALEAADQLMELGHAPIVPHLSHFWNQRSPKPYEVWMNLDFVLLTTADAILLLPGISPGRGREHALALRLGKQILHEMPPRAPIPTWDAILDPGSPAEDF